MSTELVRHTVPSPAHTCVCRYPYLRYQDKTQSPAIDPCMHRGERAVEISEGGGIRWLLGALFVVLLAACGQVESKATPPAPDEPDTSIFCKGVFAQGGLVLCQTDPGAVVEVIRFNKSKKRQSLKINADDNGEILIGFDRDDKDVFLSAVNPKNPVEVTAFHPMLLKPREYTISRIDGLPPSQVSTFSDEQVAHIRASSKRKKKGFSSRQQTLWFKDGFTYPLKDFIKTSPFGAQRILNGEAKKPHYGVDIAAPAGTPIYAPADGVVSLADDDLYFEGQMVLIDHGQGLISMYLHMSDIDVKPGQEVKRGQQIGAVGSTGRSTGPHLCWRLKWRNRNLDPELLTEWPND